MSKSSAELHAGRLLVMSCFMFVRRVDEDHSSHLGVVGAGSDERADG